MCLGVEGQEKCFLLFFALQPDVVSVRPLPDTLLVVLVLLDLPPVATTPFLLDVFDQNEVYNIMG
jgi:hypothetical protein